MTNHKLKTDKEPFEAQIRGIKNFEIRKEDRILQIGEYLILKETRFTGEEMAKGKPLIYTGRQITRKITYIQRGYGLPDNLVVLGTEKV